MLCEAHDDTSNGSRSRSCFLALTHASGTSDSRWSSNAFVHDNSIPVATKKIYVAGAGKDHYFSTDRFES
jgi:hypothetical protein